MGKRRAITPEIDALLVEVESQGWSVQRTGSDHWKAVSPEGQAVFLPSTSSDRRAWLNCRSKLRQAGASI